jgi:hypothetical protein
MLPWIFFTITGVWHSGSFDVLYGEAAHIKSVSMEPLLAQQLLLLPKVYDSKCCGGIQNKVLVQSKSLY